jgi:transcriptional regulator with XRE-family HTH domain
MRLKEVLKEKGVSQGQLSRGANLALQTVQRMCNKPGYVPDADTLVKVARFLDVPVESLYIYED